KQENNAQQGIGNSSHVWDCGSTLYDSFELNSLKRQLDSAMASRTLSMPHVTDRAPPPPSLTPYVQSMKSSKLSQSLHKLLKSVFKSRLLNFQAREHPHDRRHPVYDMSGALTTILEAPEIDFGSLSPEINPFVRKATSKRYMASNVGVS
ncbi:hypothetical protein CFOL_v3_07075, partial [Cephalotus follicularis]